MSDTYTLIKNGMVIDGTGSDPAQCDVLVHGPRIVQVLSLIHISEPTRPY